MDNLISVKYQFLLICLFVFVHGTLLRRVKMYRLTSHSFSALHGKLNRRMWTPCPSVGLWPFTSDLLICLIFMNCGLGILLWKLLSELEFCEKSAHRRSYFPHGRNFITTCTLHMSVEICLNFCVHNRHIIQLKSCRCPWISVQW